MGWRDWLPWGRPPEPQRPRLSYEGGKASRRTDGWLTPVSDGNASVEASIEWLRRRSHDLVRNNALAAKGTQALVTAMVGGGIWPQSNTGDEALDRLVDDTFRRWAEDCQTDADMDWTGAQVSIARALVESGDALVRRRLRRLSDGFAVPLQIQVLEGESLDHTVTHQTANGYVVQGVEFNPLDQRIAYWLHRQHPGSSLPFGTSLQVSRVPAESVAHVYDPSRPGQVRGVPWLAPAIIKLRDWDDYTDATLVRLKALACLVATVNDDDEYDADPGINPRAIRDSNNNIVDQIEPGAILIGRDITIHPPAGAGVDPATSSQILHEIAAALRMPYELLTGDLSQVNYSSIRYGTLDFKATIRQRQRVMWIPQFLRPAYGWFLDAAIASGVLPERDYPVVWRMPEWEEVDAEKAAAAIRAEVRDGTMSWIEAVARKGKDPEALAAEIARSNALLDRHGLVLDSDPRQDAGGFEPADTPQDDAPPGEAVRSVR